MPICPVTQHAPAAVDICVFTVDFSAAINLPACVRVVWMCVSSAPAGITLDVVLVTLICPKAVIGGKATAAAGQGALQKWLATVPAAALEANVKGKAAVHHPCNTVSVCVCVSQ